MKKLIYFLLSNFFIILAILKISKYNITNFISFLFINN